MKLKRLICAVTAVALLLSALVCYKVFANDVNWRYDSETKTLYISGSGPMDDYENSYSAPWNPYILTLENLVVEEGVTSVGNYALAGAEKLSSVSLADTVTTVGEYAFASCPALKELRLSEYVTNIKDYSFAYNGVSLKDDFVLSAPLGSYALHYIIANNRKGGNIIDFKSDDVKCGEYGVHITVGGMFAYYPYTPKVSGTYCFYSTGGHDTRGYIYDSSYTRIAYNDDYGSGVNFKITSVSLTAGQTYYFGAKIMNSSLTGTFNVYIEPVQFTVSGHIYAMLNPEGDASDIVITEALIDDEATGGEFTRTVTERNANVLITVGDNVYEYTFSPDNGNDIVLNVCDMNNDGCVNGRDWAYMKTSDSKYKPLFSNFI